MNAFKVTLPDRSVMLERLLKVNDNVHWQCHLYPTLLKEAGKEKLSDEVTNLLIRSIETYAEKYGLPFFARVGLLQLSPAFVDALITDAKPAEQEKEFARTWCIPKLK